jgi:hypothetical protein
VVWISGAFTRVGPSGFQIEEVFGSKVDVQLLGAGATAFFLLRDGSWASADPDDAVLGQTACVEALLADQALLALRVFLGAACGPS